jgi:hypothetical protein
VYTGAEVDYLEEEQGRLFAYEFKLSAQAAKPPQSFIQAYPAARFHTVHMENWLEFVA